ncbi:DUF1376 domain-containing protein [Bartonella melophagi]|uniref:Uncharacterized protein n=1 Tax=Bartonella melophagi K-2C TaxID=1094557 RepID=J1K1N9_9HYPH|nr:DUF1376 domain-containing protein [Bartonella melophagi]EJF90965.1 hypothetical protein ME3_00554 [Bartonella melophagi K-2C]
MSTKLPWVKSFSSDCLADTSGMKAFQIATYVILQWHMRRSGEPIFCDPSKLAHSAGCSVKAFNKALDFLLRDQKIVRLEDGRLWSLQVEEELKNFIDKQEHISQVRSEAGRKGAQAKMLKKQSVNDYVEAKCKQNNNFVEANDKQNQAIKNQNKNIYKKTNTIVLSKKENGSEDLATEVSVQDETTDEMVEQHLDHDRPFSENQSSVSQQESTEKKTKRSGDRRGCRLPEDFKPDLQYALEKGLTHDEALLEFEKFKNFWIAKSGQGAIKKDWKLTWYNWVISDYGLLAQKAKLGKEKQNGRYGNYSQRQKSFTERLTESFESSRHNFSSGDDYEEDQPRVSIDLQEWERIDEAGGRKSLGCLQPSTEIVQCESFG